MTTRRQDLLAIMLLIALWLLFFWRLLTPMLSDHARLVQGDFSGQFVAFGAYQYERFAEGQVPLWDPYNNSGLPFIADTQAAVFYPPRLLTIALASLAGGWSYIALELEMTAHVLLYSLLLYVLIRRMTLGMPGSVVGGLIAAVVGSYGGFMSGYPQLQLAVLEAGIWLPLALLGLVEAFRRVPLRWPWLCVTGFALGLSWMAGHPQTSWFLTYLLLAYAAFRVYTSKQRWAVFAGAVVLFGLIAVGMAAVQLLPGLEYLPRTARTAFSFEAKGNGFPFQDLLQVLFPGQLSLFSPLYMGVSAFALILLLPWRWREVPEGRFWGAVVLLSLGLSFGAHTVIFQALYNLLPGLRFFRGQERAAYLVASGLALLAGLTTVHLASRTEPMPSHLKRVLLALVAACAAGILLAPSGWQSERPDQNLNVAVFSTLIAVATYLILSQSLDHPGDSRPRWLLLSLIVFELFSVNMGANYDTEQPRLTMTPPPLVAQALADTDTPFRVDGFRGLGENYGSLYDLMDMRGISPLFIDNAYQLIEPEKINPLAWELFAVRYVYSDWEQLPVPSQIVGTGEDRLGPVNLHRLSDPRPFATLIYQAEIIPGDDFARELLHDPNYDPRHSIILDQDPDLDLPAEPPDSGSVSVTSFEPEHLSLSVDTPENALLSLAQPDYPGWTVTVDDAPAVLLRAYTALSAVAVPAGQHQIELHYDPLSYRIGAILSLLTWLGLAILGLFVMVRSRRPHGS